MINNPPPIRTPLAFANDPDMRGFFDTLLRHVYFQWDRTGGQSGTVPIVSGGTGGTTPAEARTNLSLYSIAEVDAIAEEGRRYALLVS